MPQIDVKNFVSEWKNELKKRARKEMRLTVLQIGDDPASNSYIAGKIKDCKELGISFELKKYPTYASEELIYANIQNAKNPIILQLPVPQKINLDYVNSIIPSKFDVDGFSPLSSFIPCTPGGIIHLLDQINFKYRSAKAVVIGRSKIVGRPMAKMLLDKDMTVSVCHSKTAFVDLVKLTNEADLIISAIGKENSITDMFINNLKKQTLIDVGINRVHGKLVGDASPEIYSIPDLYYTPVPGGVGLLTRAQLMENIILSYEKFD